MYTSKIYIEDGMYRSLTGFAMKVLKAGLQRLFCDAFVECVSVCARAPLCLSFLESFGSAKPGIQADIFSTQTLINYTVALFV